MSGKRSTVQFFPTGARRGRFDSTACASLGVRAMHGTRIILAASQEDSWELAAWRCIRVVPGHTLRSERKNGLPGLRIPDLDTLDAFDAKRAETDLVSTYPEVARLDEGEGWTFGRVGTLKNRIRFVWIEREDVDRVPSDPETVATAIVQALKEAHPGAVDSAISAAIGGLRAVLADPDEAVAALESLRQG